MTKLKTAVSSILGCLALVGCGKSASTGNGTVAIQSGNFTTSMAGVTFFAAPAVTDFKVCVARVKLEDEDGKAHVKSTTDSASDSAGGVKLASSDESSEIKFTPGLIDLSSGEAKTLGTVEIPTGFSVRSLRFKVKKDKSLCGVDYSVRFNGVESPQDVEFKFKFEPALAVSAATQQLELSFAEVIAALRTAAQNGDLAHMKDHVEAAEGKAK